MTREEIAEVVKQVLLEERATQTAIQDVDVLKVVAAILTGFGINEDDRKEIREDFIYLRRWRKTSQQIERSGWIALMGVFITGIAAALVLGIKALLGAKGIS
jgi:hypothetical protein